MKKLDWPLFSQIKANLSESVGICLITGQERKELTFAEQRYLNEIMADAYVKAYLAFKQAQEIWDMRPDFNADPFTPNGGNES